MNACSSSLNMQVEHNIVREVGIYERQGTMWNQVRITYRSLLFTHFRT